MPKFEIDLPDYVVAKRQKGTRKNNGETYDLYYWQPRRDLREAGFRSVALGRDLTKAIASSKDAQRPPGSMATRRRSRSRTPPKRSAARSHT
jgi:hypothetical protein